METHLVTERDMNSLRWQLVGEKQKELQINSMQLLFYQAPISAAILVVPILLLEPVSQLFFRSWSITEIVSIKLERSFQKEILTWQSKFQCLLASSCLIAFIVNLSIYWIIGNTSALT